MSKEKMQPILDDEGIEVIEAARDVKIEELPELGSMVYVATRTGRPLQGPNVTTDYHYQCIPVDTSQRLANATRHRLRSIGYERVNGVDVPNFPNAEIWRIRQDQYRKIQELRKSREYRPRDSHIDTARTADGETDVQHSVKRATF